MPERLKEYHKVFSGNLIAKNRLKKVGHLSKEDAINYAITGPSGRGSNWAATAVRSTRIPSIRNLISRRCLRPIATLIHATW